jgi:serine/threonine protein kinase
MPISPATRLGRYEIRSLLGAGGMGEVYLARDPKINRDVAIKVIPAAFSADTERLRRFEQEAQAAGALNHPNILSIYDVDTHDGSPYVVSELLEGETVREQLQGAALPVRKAIDYALQVARGLAAAHEKGIVHRDLKPENLFVTKDGHVKILDFGLAKLIEPNNGSEALTDLSTRMLQTDPGTVLGTVGYMSPEQVRAQKVDHRSDIFSLGVILYEMLSGRRAFRGDSTIETLNAILKEDPPELSESNGRINPALERVVMHCLEKSPEQRFQSARDVAFALEGLSSLTSSHTLPTPLPAKAGRSINRERLAWIAAGVCLLGFLAALSIGFLRKGNVDQPVLSLSLLPPDNVNMSGIVSAMALSPDGRRLAFVGSSQGQNRLWVRSLDSPSAQVLSGTEGASTAGLPFWSPDSRFVGFTAGGKLKKIDASGGSPQTLCDVGANRGGTWSRDGVIVFAMAGNGPLYRVSAEGGEPTPVTTLDKSRSETSHRWPFFLPDGQHFLYFARSSQVEGGGVYVGSLDAKQAKQLLPTTLLNAIYASPGYLLFVRDKTLLAQRFDADKLQLSGEPFPVAEHVASNPGLARGAFSVSESGVLAYYSGSGDLNQPLWFDRGGKQIGSLGELGLYFTLGLSPDGKRAAVNRADQQMGTNDIWLFDLLRGVPLRFTTDPAGDSNPLWSPDGSRIVFTSNREGVGNLYQKITSGGGNEELLLKSSDEKWPNDWTADGQFIVYQTFNAKTKWDLWLLPMSGDRQPTKFLETQFNEHQAQFSPEGKWIVYTSDESGTSEIYARTFPATDGKWRISTGGGSQPTWRRDGRELFYIASDRKLMAVDVKPGNSFEASIPKPLFQTRVLSLTDFGNHYAVSADGQRFLINSTIETNASPISVVVNWTANLKH